MDSVRIFHMADAHLDAPFTTLSPREAELARRSLRSAFAAALLAAKNRGVKLFLIAGDLFDSTYVTPDTKDFVCRRLKEYGDIRFFISPGNHDPYDENSPYRTMPFSDNVHIFDGKSVVRLEELGVAVYGSPFTSSEMRESPLKGLPPINPELINILVCHGDVAAGDSPYGPISLKELGDSGFDYVALGHIHRSTGVLCHGGVHFAYPGCIEGRGFDETGDKGALVGSVSKGRAELGFLSLARRKYAVETVDVSGMESRTGAIEAIRSVMRPYGSDTHLRLVLTGTPAVLLGITEELFATGGSDPASIEILDKTLPMPRLTEAEKKNTLRGVFLRRMQDRLSGLDGDSEEYALLVRALKIGLAALDGRDITGV